jgi:hypothetical protein
MAFHLTGGDARTMDFQLAPRKPIERQSLYRCVGQHFSLSLRRQLRFHGQARPDSKWLKALSSRSAPRRLGPKTAEHLKTGRSLLCAPFERRPKLTAESSS